MAGGPSIFPTLPYHVLCATHHSPQRVCKITVQHFLTTPTDMGGAQSHEVSGMMQKLNELGLMVQDSCPDKQYKILGKELCDATKCYDPLKQYHIANTILNPSVNSTDVLNDSQCGQSNCAPPICRHLFDLFSHRERASSRTTKSFQNSSDTQRPVHDLETGAEPRSEKSSQSTKTSDPAKDWFEGFKSEGKTLDEEQVQKLIDITAKWQLDKRALERRRVCLEEWKSKPDKFWGITQDPKTASDAIANCSEYENLVIQSTPTLTKLRKNVLKTLVCLAARFRHEQQRSETRDLDSTKGKMSGGNWIVAEEIRKRRGLPEDQKKVLYDYVTKQSHFGASLLYLGLGRILGLGGTFNKYAM